MPAAFITSGCRIALQYEQFGFSPDTIELLQRMGHTMVQNTGQGVAEVIVVDAKTGGLDSGVDRRAPDGGARGR